MAGRLRSRQWLIWVSGRPCARCGRQGSTQAHHFKGTGMRSGVGLRAPDNWTVPLCFRCHNEFHGDPWPGAAEDQYKWLAETLAAWIDEFAATAPREFARAVATVAAEADR